MLAKLEFILVRIIFIASLIFPNLLWGQNYNFTNFNLKEGLPQSQVSVIFQAKDHTLWLGSFGGVSNFDGRSFKSYSKADGLLSNNVSSITEDQQRRIWVGSENGINLIEDGKVKSVLHDRDIYNIQQATDGTMWVLAERGLYMLKGNRLLPANLPESGIVTTLNKDKQGRLYAYVRGAGLFELDKKQWKLFKVFPADLANAYIIKVLFDAKDRNVFHVAALRKGVFLYHQEKLTRVFKDNAIEAYYDITKDNYGNIWVATQRGAYLVNPKGNAMLFDDENGLKATRANAVFNDNEGNIWVSSFGDGIFRYDGDAFIKYSRFNGRDLSYPISGLVVDEKNQLWISTFNKGLYQFDGLNLIGPEKKFADNNIYFITKDLNSRLLVSIQNQGLWRREGANFVQVPFTSGSNISTLVHDQQGNLYLGEINTVTYLGADKIEKIGGFKGWVSCLFALGKDSVLLGTSSGVYLIKNQQLDTKFKIQALSSAYILGILKHRNKVLFATLGDGLIIYDLKHKKTERYHTAQGLNSNDIYSLVMDQNQVLWLGTGRGINKLKLNSRTGRYQVIPSKTPIIECNQNAAVAFNGDILLGSTTGVILGKTSFSIQKTKPPYISFQKIDVYDKSSKRGDSTISLIAPKKQQIVLRHTQSRIAISFRGISLSNPQSVVYHYCLIGVDRDFGKPVKAQEAEYSALSPGEYTFKVYAEVNGLRSDIKELNFIIKPPFYVTVWFRVLVAVIFLLLGWGLIFLMLKRREFQRRQRQKIKMEEQAKIRKQTAEDFHDDIGNKLTRINVLSEILDKKIAPNSEQKELVRLIKENAGLLYTGTKDVLWALDPQSDNFYAIMQRIRDFGLDLFQNTTVGFEMDELPQAYQNWQMSMEQNRNLTLIFKEVLNNVLKHAQATKVCIRIFEEENQAVQVEVQDNGKGFDMLEATGGNGLKNISNRVNRINAKLTVHTHRQAGTRVVISGIKPLRYKRK
ncbi:ligand-binding sensor domain-containing protein [Nubsella zeaxanthinifaciens]|uniref:ligand-binding sensor domain-containing protein n=1 Tax=Nubsella zeaxanthinifaciens TaxID=392412 RepID=UPI003D07B992